MIENEKQDSLRKTVRDDLLTLRSILLQNDRADLARSIEHMIACLDESDIQSMRIKFTSLMQSHHGSLSDFVIWHNDIEERKKINGEVENIKNNLRNFLD